MFKLLCCAAACLLVVSLGWAGQAVEAPAACLRCGMDRTVFAHSRAQVGYTDGSSAGTCSLHCAVEEIRNSPGRKVASLKVADFGTRQLVDPEGAVWVVGGRVRGVMTAPAKWAFARRQDAQRFVQENGGSITAYHEVLRAVQEEVAEMEQPARLE